jgi:hypothetical protein
MGKRSGILEHEIDFRTGSLAELDTEIRRCDMMRKISNSARNRKSLESRIHWLERVRSRHPELNQE